MVIYAIVCLWVLHHLSFSLLWLVLATINIHQPLFPLKTSTLLYFHHLRVPRRSPLLNLPHLQTVLYHHGTWLLMICTCSSRWSLLFSPSPSSPLVDSMLSRVFNWLLWLFELLVVDERSIFSSYLLWLPYLFFVILLWKFQRKILVGKFPTRICRSPIGRFRWR